jgi:hypothetical protein
MPVVELTVDSSGAVTGLKQYEGEVQRAGRSTDSLGGKVKSIGASFAKFTAIVTAVGSSLVVGLGMKAVQAASLMEDTQDKFDVVFNGMTDSANKWAEELQRDYIMSRRESKLFLASTQDLLVPMGMQADAAGKMSFEVAKLASDLSAFNPEVKTSADAMRDMQSALTGEYQVMKKYGIVISDTIIKERARAEGLWSGKGVLDANTKAQLAFKLMLEGSKAAIGDTIRTQSSYESQLKRLRANMEDFTTQVGEYLIPYANQAITTFNDWAIKGNGLNTTIKFLIESARFLYNGFMGIKLSAQAVIVAFAYLAKGASLVLKPLELLLSGLQKLGVIDTNPLKALSDNMTLFVDSAVDGLEKTWAKVEEGNVKFDELSAGVGNSTSSIKVDIETVAEAQKKWNEEIRKTGEEIEKSWKTQSSVADKTISSTSRVIAALKGQSDQLALVNGKWVNIKDSAAEYGRVVAGNTTTMKTNEEALKGTAKAADTKGTSDVKASVEAAKLVSGLVAQGNSGQYAKTGVMGAATAADAYAGAAARGAAGTKGEGNKDPAKTGKSYSFNSGAELMKTAEGILAIMKSDQEKARILDSQPGQRRPSLSEFTQWNQGARDRTLQSRRDRERYLTDQYVSKGGNAGDFYGGGGSSNVTVHINQAVSRSDIVNIINEIQRNGARA